MSSTNGPESPFSGTPIADDVVESHRVGRLGHDGVDGVDHVAHRHRAARRVEHDRALDRRTRGGDELARDVARVLQLRPPAVGDLVRRAARGREHGLRGSRRHALIAAEAVDGVGPQADARDPVVGPVDAGRLLVGALEDAVERGRGAALLVLVAGLGRVVGRDRRGVGERAGERPERAHGLEDDDRPDHVDARAERRVRAHERHLQRREVDHVRDPALLHRARELGQVGHVAAHLVERRELGIVEQQPQPVVAAAEVVGRDAAAFVEQQADRPGADAPVRAGDQVPLSLTRLLRRGPVARARRPAARLPCGRCRIRSRLIIASTVSRRTFGPDAVEYHATCGESKVLRRGQDAAHPRQRLAREDVECRAADPACLEASARASSSISAPRETFTSSAPGRIPRTASGAEQLLGRRQQRQVQRDEVARRPAARRGCRSGLDAVGQRRADRVVGLASAPTSGAHATAIARPMRPRPTRPSVSDSSGAHAARATTARPTAARQAVGLDQPPVQRQQHRDGVRRDLVGGVVGEVDDRDAGRLARPARSIASSPIPARPITRTLGPSAAM